MQPRTVFSLPVFAVVVVVEVVLVVVLCAPEVWSVLLGWFGVLLWADGWSGLLCCDALGWALGLLLWLGYEPDELELWATAMAAANVTIAIEANMRLYMWALLFRAFGCTLTVTRVQTNKMSAGCPGVFRPYFNSCSGQSCWRILARC